jgi:hypothetical protein
MQQRVSHVQRSPSTPPITTIALEILDIPRKLIPSNWISYRAVEGIGVHNVGHCQPEPLINDPLVPPRFNRS